MLTENGVDAASEAARLLGMAAGSLRAGRPAEAIMPLQAASHLLPGEAAILHDLGLANLECGRVGEAIGALRSAVALDAGFADAHLRLGIALEASGELGPALESYHKAAQSPRSAADASYRAGNLLDSLSRTADAIDAFGCAAAAAPGTVLGCIASARALLAGGREPEAERILRIALALEPQNPVALDLLGNTLAALWSRARRPDAVTRQSVELGRRHRRRRTLRARRRFRKRPAAPQFHAVGGRAAVISCAGRVSGARTPACAY